MKSVLIVAMAGLAAYGAGQIHSWVVAQEVPVGGPIPYTVTLREILHHPDGSASVPSESTWAVRSDGSTVRRLVHKRPAGDAGQEIAVGVTKSSERVVNFTSGIEVAINELTGLKSTTMPNRGMPATWQRDPQSQCINSMAGKPMTSMPEAVVGKETVAGYRTVKIQMKDPTSWFALDHGCAMVKSRWDFGGGEVSEKSLLALIPGEPDAALFEVPKDAREVLPSERVLGSNKDCAGCSKHVADVFRGLDAEYVSHRPVEQR